MADVVDMSDWKRRRRDKAAADLIRAVSKEQSPWDVSRDQERGCVILTIGEQSWELRPETARSFARLLGIQLRMLAEKKSAAPRTPRLHWMRDGSIGVPLCRSRGRHAMLAAASTRAQVTCKLCRRVLSRKELRAPKGPQ